MYKQAIEGLFGTWYTREYILVTTKRCWIKIFTSQRFHTHEERIQEIQFSNVPRYINGWVYIHNLFKDLRGDKDAQECHCSILTSHRHANLKASDEFYYFPNFLPDPSRGKYGDNHTSLSVIRHHLKYITSDEGKQGKRIKTSMNWDNKSKKNEKREKRECYLEKHYGENKKSKFSVVNLHKSTIQLFDISFFCQSQEIYKKPGN